MTPKLLFSVALSLSDICHADIIYPQNAAKSLAKNALGGFGRAVRDRFPG